MGALCSLILAISLIGFTFTKMNNLVSKTSSLTNVLLEDYFEPDEVFKASEKKFFFAAALTPYDSSTESIEDETYGRLVFRMLDWGNVSFAYNEIEAHYCTDEELGFKNGPETLIFPPSKNIAGSLKTWKNKFKCMDTAQNLELWGDYNTDVG